MKWLVFGLLLGSWGLPESIEGARFLAFLPFPAKSHHAVFTPIIRGLLAKGHHVTQLTPLPLADPPPNYREILIPNILAELLATVDINNFGGGPIFEFFKLFEMGLYFNEKICVLEPVQKLIHSDDQYDVILLESFFVQELYSVLQHKFNAIGVDFMPLGSSSWLYHMTGSPFNPAYDVDFKMATTDRMTYWERVKNSALHLFSVGVGYLYYMPKYQALADKYLNYTGWESRPPLTELISNKSIVLQNSHISLNYPYTYAPHIIDIGGINVNPKNKPLPKDLQAFMDGSTEGVIYLSLGSNLNGTKFFLDEGRLEAFQRAFGRLKQRVLWKWEAPQMPNQPKNVFISKWFPQQDILAHKKCRLFITHGGYLSQTESINYGVPMVGLPFFGDQAKNLRFAEYAGFGVQLNTNNITEDSVYWAVTKGLEPSYKEAAEFRSKLFRERVMTPVDTAVYWIEYAIKYKGAAHLRPALAYMSSFTAHNLDIWPIFLLIALLPPVGIVLVVKRILCSPKSKPKPKNQNKKTN